MLVRAELVTREQLYEALRLQREKGWLLGTCLLSLGYIAANDLLEILGHQLQVPVLPPGSLKYASKEATQLIPAKMAMHLRAVPYSFDGNMLGMAIADGRVLDQLHLIATHALVAVGAYLTLEMELESALREIYGSHALPLASAECFPGRPRPMRANRPSEIPTHDFGKALGLHQEQTTIILSRPVSGPVPRPPIPTTEPAPIQVMNRAPPPAIQTTPSASASGNPPMKGPPPAVGATDEVHRVNFYDAIESIYQASDITTVAQCVVQALLNYFQNIVAFVLTGSDVQVVAFGGSSPRKRSVGLEAMPAMLAGMGRRKISYGTCDADPRTSEICRAFGLPSAGTSFIAPIDSEDQLRVILYAENGSSTELYDDLHDIEMLLKEAETALGIIATNN